MVYRHISKDLKECALWLISHGYAPGDICEVFDIIEKSINRWKVNNLLYGSSVAATRPAVSRLTKPRLFSDSTGPTAPYLLESRLRLGRNFQSTQVDFFCLFFSFQNYILQHIKKHKVLLFYYVNVQCASYKLVTFIWTGLPVNPAHMTSALLDLTIKMLDITHHPCHFNASLKRQMTLRLHLPLRARRSPWPDFGWV